MQNQTGMLRRAVNGILKRNQTITPAVETQGRRSRIDAEIGIKQSAGLRAIDKPVMLRTDNLGAALPSGHKEPVHIRIGRKGQIVLGYIVLVNGILSISTLRVQPHIQFCRPPAAAAGGYIRQIQRQFAPTEQIMPGVDIANKLVRVKHRFADSPASGIHPSGRSIQHNLRIPQLFPVRSRNNSFAFNHMHFRIAALMGLYAELCSQIHHPGILRAHGKTECLRPDQSIQRAARQLNMMRSKDSKFRRSFKDKHRTIIKTDFYRSLQQPQRSGLCRKAGTVFQFRLQIFLRPASPNAVVNRGGLYAAADLSPIGISKNKNQRRRRKKQGRQGQAAHLRPAGRNRCRLADNGRRRRPAVHLNGLSRLLIFRHQFEKSGKGISRVD